MGEITTEELRKRYEAGERDFRGLDLSGIELSGTFTDADFSDVNFQFLEIYYCSFKGCDLSGADFRGTCINGFLKIEECVFTELNLSHIFGSGFVFSEGDFRRVKLKRISLNYGRAASCDLRGIDFSESRW